MKLQTALVTLALLAIGTLVLVERQQTKAELARLRAQLQTRAEDDAAAPRALVDGRVPTAPSPPRAAELAPAAPADPAGDTLDGPPRRVPRAPRLPPSRIEAFATIHETMGAAFVAEPVEGAWASRATYLVRDKLAAALPSDSRLESIECHATLCRIRSLHDNLASANRFIDSRLAANGSLPWNGPFSVGVVEQAPNDGPVTLVTYFGREGHDLPLVPPDEEAP
jgi:hypothetical protein